MPIANIVDKRTNKYLIHVEAIFEPSKHDNLNDGASQFDLDDHAGFFYKEIPETTIQRAIEDMATNPAPITLFLYDIGTNCVDPT